MKPHQLTAEHWPLTEDYVGAPAGFTKKTQKRTANHVGNILKCFPENIVNS